MEQVLQALLDFLQFFWQRLCKILYVNCSIIAQVYVRCYYSLFSWCECPCTFTCIYTMYLLYILDVEFYCFFNTQMLTADECFICCVDKTAIKRMKLSMRSMIGRLIADEMWDWIVSVGVDDGAFCTYRSGVKEMRILVCVQTGTAPTHKHEHTVFPRLPYIYLYICPQ